MDEAEAEVVFVAEEDEVKAGADAVLGRCLARQGLPRKVRADFLRVKRDMLIYAKVGALVFCRIVLSIAAIPSNTVIMMSVID